MINLREEKKRRKKRRRKKQPYTAHSQHCRKRKYVTHIKSAEHQPSLSSTERNKTKSALEG
jgi:hypothetical protein